MENPEIISLGIRTCWLIIFFLPSRYLGLSVYICCAHTPGLQLFSVDAILKIVWMRRTKRTLEGVNSRIATQSANAFLCRFV